MTPNDIPNVNAVNTGVVAEQLVTFVTLYGHTTISIDAVKAALDQALATKPLSKAPVTSPDSNA